MGGMLGAWVCSGSLVHLIPDSQNLTQSLRRHAEHRRKKPLSLLSVCKVAMDVERRVEVADGYELLRMVGAQEPGRQEASLP